MRRLAVLVAAGAALWLAPGAFAAGWCGTGESSTDRPDTTTGQQIHAIVAIPSDGTDNFAADANRLQNDADSLTTWWTGQDATRAPRFDQAVFPGGTCLDISFVRLTVSTAQLQSANAAFTRVRAALAIVSFQSPYKKYLVYYDGPPAEADICGTGAGDFSRGPAYAVVWLQGCPDIGGDAVSAHELIHALGALPLGAPHACPGDPGHPCDSPLDVLYPTADPSRTLQQEALDVGRDDYYGHSGTWDDIQDSLWLRHLDTPQEALTVTMAGTGNVTSEVPGVACGAPCTTQWDQGSLVTLVAAPARGQRFVRWSGACAGSGNCAVNLTQPQSVTAVFGPSRVALRVTTKGRGAVRCTPACSRTVLAGKPITLRAVPAKGWSFTGWSGACKGTRTVCRPPTTAAVSVRATFRRKSV